jgi:hypothetical protein
MHYRWEGLNKTVQSTTSSPLESFIVLGMHFYVGVVLGVFFAWTGIGSLLGLPDPAMPMIGMLIFRLLISYTMVWCYNFEDEDEDEDENESEECANYLAVKRARGDQCLLEPTSYFIGGESVL